MRDYLLVYINGRKYRVGGEDSFTPLSSYLRSERQATGTKVVCEEGDCGACTVLLGKSQNGEIVYKPINSCIQYMYQLDCTHVITVEGLRSNGCLNPVQQSMVKHHGAQCGFCTPGFIVAMCSMFCTGVAPATAQSNICQQDVKDALTGNLCRCTGYEPIIRAALEVDTSQIVGLQEMYPSAEILADFQAHEQLPILIDSDGRKFYNPTAVGGAVEFKDENRGTVIVSGGTDVCVQCNKKGLEPAVLMSLSNLSDLKTLKTSENKLIIGARVSLQDLEYFLKDLVPEMYEILRVFGSPQIKHAATLAGNIANASPIADTLPFLFVMDAEVVFAGIKGERVAKIRSLYKGYKVLDWSPDELITEIRVPLPGPNEILKLYKVSKRKNLDISTFTAAFRMTKKDNRIEDIAIAYGGVAPVVLMLPETAAFLTGKAISLSTFQAAAEVARKEITPISDVRGSSDFRNYLAETILEKFHYETADDKELACR